MQQVIRQYAPDDMGGNGTDKDKDILMKPPTVQRESQAILAVLVLLGIHRAQTKQ